MTDNKTGKSLLSIHAAVLLFGTAGLFGKLVAQPSTVIVFGRVLFASLFLVAVSGYRRHPIRLKAPADYATMAALGGLLAVHWVAFFQSIQIATVAVGLLTFSTFPVFVTFLEPLLFKERLRWGDAVIAAVTLFGVWLVVPQFDEASRIARGALWGVGAGASFALLSVCNRKAVSSYSGLTVAFYQDAAAAVFLLPWVWIRRPVVGWHDAVALVFLGVVFTGVSHALFIQGLRRVKAHTASIITCLEPVYGIVLAAALLKEIPGVRESCGGAVILAASFWVSLRARPRR